MRVVRGFLIVMVLWVAGSGATQAADAPGLPRELRDVRVEQRGSGVAVTCRDIGPAEVRDDDARRSHAPGDRRQWDIRLTTVALDRHAGAAQGDSRQPVQARHGAAGRRAESQGRLPHRGGPPGPYGVDRCPCRRSGRDGDVGGVEAAGSSAAGSSQNAGGAQNAGGGGEAIRPPRRHRTRPRCLRQ